MIRSRRNETLKAIRRLRRRQGDHALLEGPQLLQEALQSGTELETVLVSPEYAASPRGAELLLLLPRPALLVEPALLADLLDADSPRGVLAVAKLGRGSESSLPLVDRGLYLFLDGVQDPGNVGAIARVAEAFGVTALALGVGCASPNHPRAQRAAAGSLLRLPVICKAAPELLDLRLASLSPVWAALDAHGGDPIPDSMPQGALLLVLGAEGTGLSAASQARVRERWTLPISPAVESLNVAVAAGIALHSLRRVVNPHGNFHGLEPLRTLSDL